MFYWWQAWVHLDSEVSFFFPPGQICNSGVHLFFCFTPVRKGRLIPVAPGKCICLCLKECSYCLFISRFSLSFFFFIFPALLSTLWHLQSFTCILFSLSPPFFTPLSHPHHHNLSPSVSSSGACIPAMGYCFSNLADSGQYLCIVFQYPFLMLT